MTAVEISTLLQNGVVSTLAILLFWRLPEIWRAFLDYIERQRAFDAQQDRLERDSRHMLVTENAKALEALTVAVAELRTASQNLCRFKG